MNKPILETPVLPVLDLRPNQGEAPQRMTMLRAQSSVQVAPGRMTMMRRPT
jgi:hypothetical protein